MRTNGEENAQMGRIFAEKLNAATGPVAVLIPLRGVSILDGDGELFCDRESRPCLWRRSQSRLWKKASSSEEVDHNINDPAFCSRGDRAATGANCRESRRVMSEKKTFVQCADVKTQVFDWGRLNWLSEPLVTRGRAL